MDFFDEIVGTIDGIGIFVHNTTIALPMFIPGFGVAWGLFSAYSTGFAYSAIAAATNPLKPGESGSVTFLAGAPGTYYYICTVPGHALQGMQGSFIVE